MLAPAGGTRREHGVHFGGTCEVTVAGDEFRKRTAGSDRGVQVIKRGRRVLFHEVLTVLSQKPEVRAVVTDSGSDKVRDENDGVGSDRELKPV